MIESNELCRSFNGNSVVQGPDLSAKDGKVFGFPGPNGAGILIHIRQGYIRRGVIK